ncbi:MAG: hypothetical protein UX80_C0002G0024 [Candidatus Amesbacteria bacterium GW2011_GWA2_47_11b]|uniref:Glycosyltransferase RgtA/B/C/D-like domain-containing protein n=1 Tax=Candidatus Amesbacteria bacterium GW2011_GWA2_47_11b TaxID=1618358 RepID=A0A0G1RMB2_9BACT|nr:MAG: hypothetical protein UX80_C0002G0024 [Candidatus Amesbacteria bacterium GW2011_GWA2_47_11b]
MKYFLLFLVLLPGVIIRFIWLDQVPPGLNHDEMDAVMIARSYAYFGTDTLGEKFPISLIKNQVETGDDTLLSLLLSPFQRLLPVNVYIARLPMVIINLLTILLWTILVYRLTANKKLALVFLALFLYSPWSIIFSRSLTQAPLALLLISLSLNIFWKNTALAAFLGAIFLDLAFLAYYGTKPFTIIMGLILPIWLGFTRKKFKISVAIIFWLVFGLFVAGYIYFAFTIPGSTFSRRRQEIRLSTWSQIGATIDTARRTSISNPFSFIFLNKPAEFTRLLLQKYWNYWSPDYLLFSGDPSSNQRLTFHGAAYLPDLFFSALGLGMGMPGISLAALLITLGPVGTLVNNSLPANMYRGAPFLPGLLLLIAAGITKFTSHKKLLPVVIVGYLILSLNFLHFFFYQYPVTAAETGFLGERILANYLIKTSGEVTVIAAQPLQVLQQVMYFSQSTLGDKPRLISLSGPYNYDRIHISQSCPPQLPTGTLVVQFGINCEPPSGNKLVIQDQKDTGTLWKIYNDETCSSSDLSYWRRFHYHSDYKPEIMSTDQFCNRWINKFKNI